jgi:hypothetical protein
MVPFSRPVARRAGNRCRAGPARHRDCAVSGRHSTGDEGSQPMDVTALVKRTALGGTFAAKGAL